MTRHTTTRTAFSMIELVMVVLILGVIVTIAAPRFADAGSGRRLSSGAKIIQRDIETIQLRAKATSKKHTIVFYPSRNTYMAFEGTSIEKDAVVLVRELAEEPLGLELNRTNIGDNQDIVISGFGDLEKSFTLEIGHSGTARDIAFVADGFTRTTMTMVDTFNTVRTSVSLDSGVLSLSADISK